MTSQKQGRVLIIAGSDPSGGAGIQADIKTVTALGGYAMTAITALTVQDTTGVRAVEPVAPGLIVDQIRACLDDIGADAIKIGMIGQVGAAHAIADTLATVADYIPVILDPVLVATSGDALGDDTIAEIILNRFLPDIAHVLTPNIPELEQLTGLTQIRHPDAMRAAGTVLQAHAPHVALLLKGGHLPGDSLTDLLLTQDGVEKIMRPRIDTPSTHGTGCTLASALATCLAHGYSIEESARRAIAFVDAAIRAAPGYGAGRGPLGHARVQRAMHDSSVTGE